MRFAVVLAALTLPLLSPLRAAAEVDETSWKDALKTASRSMKLAGDARAKDRALSVLARDDSLRAAELLVKWVAASQTLRQRELQPAYEEARERLEKVVSQLKKGYVEPFTDANGNGRWDAGETFKDRNRNGKRDGWPPRTMNADHRKSWDTLKKRHALALSHLQVEDMVLTRIGSAFERFTDVEALRWLSNEGIEALERAEEPGPVRLGIVGGLLGLGGEWCVERLLVLAGPGGDPKVRIRVLNWAGLAKVPQAFEFTVKALRDAHEAVRRGAVAALKAYDDPRAVKHLIDALARAEGLAAQEIEEALHWYTGRSFEGSVKVWRKWFANEGQAWLDSGDRTRHRVRKVSHSGTTTATTFYDIPTVSRRIVFVLDRSGSMKEPAKDSSPAKESKPKEPRGPVTGDKRKSKKDEEEEEEDGPIAGNTKLEIAKNKLAVTVERLRRDVQFGLVFYSTDVAVWKTPPGLLPASSGNKVDAVKWFSALEPEGSTSLFPALMKALEYADAFGAPGDDKQRRKGSSGANTIFLLSDGSPTKHGTGQVLPADVIEKQLAEFLEANKLYRCVVHTIGVGPTHNRTLMRRIAQATGGEYRAVGVD